MDTKRAVALLAACALVIARVEASGLGIYYTPTDEDWPALHGYQEVCTAFGGYRCELEFDELRAAAGLRPSEPGLLRGLLDCFYLRFPGVVEARIAEIERHLAP